MEIFVDNWISTLESWLSCQQQPETGGKKPKQPKKANAPLRMKASDFDQMMRRALSVPSEQEKKLRRKARISRLN
jgi:hypothetical protein